MNTYNIIRDQWLKTVTPLTARQKLWNLAGAVYVVVLFVVLVWGGAFLDALLRGQI